jgi:hypothetical protein
VSDRLHRRGGKNELQVEMFPVGQEVMGFENVIRFTVSHGRSKADTERTDKPHLSLLQILYPKTGGARWRSG